MNNLTEKARNEAIKMIMEVTGLSREEIKLSALKDPEQGDFSFNCCALANKLGRNPCDLAKEITDKLNEKYGGK